MLWHRVIAMRRKSLLDGQIPHLWEAAHRLEALLLIEAQVVGEEAQTVLGFGPAIGGDLGEEEGHRRVCVGWVLQSRARVERERGRVGGG